MVSGGMAGQHYCLRWNNYQSNMTSVFHQLLQTEAFVDVTLACNEASLKAHKVVLSACSSYFQKLLLSNPCKHPTIIMPQDVCFNDLKFIIEFVYRGEIDVSQAELQSLLKTADQLKIKGLCEVPESREGGGGSVGSPSGVGGGGGGPTVGGLIEGPSVSLSSPPRDSSTPHRFNFTKLKSSRHHHPRYKRPRTSFDVGGNNRLANTDRHLLLHSQHHHHHQQQQQQRNHHNHLQHQHHHHHHQVDSGKYKEEDFVESYVRDCNKENRRDCWPVEDEDCMETTTTSTTAAAAATAEAAAAVAGTTVVLDSCQRNSSAGAGGGSGGAGGDGGAGGAAAGGPDNNNISNTNSNGSNNSSNSNGPVANNNNTPAATNNNGDDMFCHTGLGHYGHHPDPAEVDLPPETQPTPPSATLVGTTITHLRDAEHQTADIQSCDSVKIKFETLHTMDSSDTIDIDSHMSDRASVSSKNADDNMMMITPELLGLMPSSSSVHSDSGENNSRSHSGQSGGHHHGSKSWTQEDMEAALDALRNHDMSLTKASATFGIPSTTLWQRAHRLGIDTPKKDGPTKSWSDESLNNALDALRTGTISANKASKAFGIPSSTLYKIARREGIRLAAPFNASPTTWTPADLDRALEAIRSGQTSVQRASTEFGIPTGTLYGRCKREGIELSRSNPTPWSEDAMTEALEAVRLGHMSINQAAIHYNLPYSSLYGRFKRGKYEEPVVNDMSQDGSSQHFHQSPTQNHSSSLPDQMPYQGS
ncbi:probable serine/threonine-protein kinase DDB_G0282963 isoform X2 [Copidosoma floridanum]|uniref:probable serine/threonine-protein kinase DDB_G0282963 isoform X2 n=1 Tax=Copidosoma floridanum TaxID=29053 RepID=UPI0006C97095|nr:probable serine/threonine-protein kinase DDB_G0282963 isoform X2 [Copidosoma floridanum]